MAIVWFLFCARRTWYFSFSPLLFRPCGYTPSLVYHHTPDDADLATTEPMSCLCKGGQTDHHCLSRESASRGRKIPE